jgi:hypothetical protein
LRLSCGSIARRISNKKKSEQEVTEKNKKFSSNLMIAIESEFKIEIKSRFTIKEEKKAFSWCDWRFFGKFFFDNWRQKLFGLACGYNVALAMLRVI